MLLAAAQHLPPWGAFSGTLNLIFQPAEEGHGGAKATMDDGLFTRFPCDAVFAMHNMPGQPQGKLLLREGATMASSDGLTITLSGKGTHGAMPHFGVIRWWPAPPSCWACSPSWHATSIPRPWR